MVLIWFNLEFGNEDEAVAVLTVPFTDNQISDIEALDLKSLSGSLVTLVRIIVISIIVIGINLIIANVIIIFKSIITIVS